MGKLRKAKWVLAGILVSTFWIYFPADSSAENLNLIKNPGFEKTVDVRYIEGWGIISLSTGCINPDKGINDSKCLELKGEGPGWARVFAYVPEVDIKKQYIFSLYMKTVDVRENGIYIEIQGKGAKGKGLLRLGDEYHRIFPLNGTNEWKKYQIVISPDVFPEGTVGLRIRPKWRSRKGIAYFDEVSLVEEGSTVNLIENPGFEGKVSTEC